MDSKRSRPLSRGGPLAIGGLLQILVMGVVLAATVFVVFFYSPSSDGDQRGGNTVIRVDNTPVPELNAEILAMARDQTRKERLQREAAPFEHLLEKSLMVVPAVARKLGMPEQPTPIAKLRANPERYRGQYLWFKGRLVFLSRPRDGHPLSAYKIHEARLETAEGDQVLFAFSVKPPADLEVGKSWVRAEGFFMKLRDDHFPQLDRAPLLVGPELMKDFPDWSAVDKLDPAVLARVHDGRWDPERGPKGDFVDGPDIDRKLVQSQDVPLWHLASYAIEHDRDLSQKQWREIPAFTHEQQLEAFRRDQIARGTPMRILGNFIQGRTFAAKVNPLGIEDWTEAHVQVRDLGGKVIPIWLPRDIKADGDWLYNTPVEVRGYYFKKYRYESASGDLRWTPLFVASRLDRFDIAFDPNHALAFAFAGVIGAVIVMFFFMARRDRRQREQHEAAMIERRRQRRQRTTAAAAGG